MIAKIITSAEAAKIFDNPKSFKTSNKTGLFLIPPASFFADGGNPFQIYPKYLEDKEGQIFTAIDNTSYNAWTEGFPTAAEAFIWLSSSSTVEDCCFHKISQIDFESIKSLNFFDDNKIADLDIDTCFMGYAVFENCTKAVYCGLENEIFQKKEFLTIEDALIWLFVKRNLLDGLSVPRFYEKKIMYSIDEPFSDVFNICKTDEA